MRCLLVALAAVAASTPVAAELDGHTAWLFRQPLTRLDALVITAEKEMSRVFLQSPDSEDTARREFDRRLAGRSIRVKRAPVVFDYDTNLLKLFVIGYTDEKPTGENCAKTLDESRDLLLHYYLYAPEGMDREDRKKAATYLMSEMLQAPAKVEAVGGPKDMAVHVAGLTRVHVTLDQADHITVYASCEGSLSGTDVDLQLR